MTKIDIYSLMANSKLILCKLLSQQMTRFRTVFQIILDNEDIPL